MDLHKIIKILAVVLSLIGIFFVGTMVVKGAEVVEATGAGLDGSLYIAYIILMLVVVMVLIFVLKGILSGNIKRTLMAVGSFLLIVVISYLMAEGVEETLPEGDVLSASGSKWVGTGLITFYILALIAILAMVYTGVNKMLKRR